MITILNTYHFIFTNIISLAVIITIVLIIATFTAIARSAYATVLPILIFIVTELNVTFIISVLTSSFDGNLIDL